MNMKKPGVKAKGKRSLTKAEQQQRVRGRARILNAEMKKIGVHPITLYLPAIYLEVIETNQNNILGNHATFEAVISKSAQLCLIIEHYIKQLAEENPQSSLANTYYSTQWISSNSIDFHGAIRSAANEIGKFEQQHEKEIN
jgi:hypothetical protein